VTDEFGQPAVAEPGLRDQLDDAVAQNRQLEQKVADLTVELEALQRDYQVYADERYRSLSDATAQAVWTSDERGESWRPFGLENLIGGDAPPLERIADFNRGFVHPDDRERVAEAWAEARDNPHPLTVTYRLLRADGSTRDVVSRAVPVLRDGGAVHEWVGVISDVTETRSLEERLHQSQKMEAIGQLAGGIAHDFNNLLTVIMQCGDLLREDLPAESESGSLVDVLLGAAGRGADLTQQLLTFSRKRVIAPTAIDVGEVVRNSIAMLGRVIAEDVAVEADMADELPCVVAATGELDQMIVNLAVNARDAMSGGGTLTFETARLELPPGDPRRGPGATRNEHILIRVTDTGHGMTQATQDRMFEPFFTTKPSGTGTGLGLSTVYGVVQRIGGTIEVDSKPGVGTTFRIFLPCADLTDETAPLPLQVSSTGHETILVVEDEPTVRGFSVRMLRQQGYDVLEAGDATEALQVAAGRDGPIDLLFADVVLPGMSGGELANRLLAIRPDLRVLYTSGYNDDEIVRRGIRTSEVRLLPKPYTRQSLSDAVRSILDIAPPGR
jgi:two-component system, cell cycle sensor histidine kinase and response regulator CckA